MYSCEYICERATDRDDVALIAKYLHLTDPYIYPKLCADPESEAWCELVGQCLKTPGNIYHLDHILVAKWKGQIVGVACMVPCGEHLTFDEGLTIPNGLENMELVVTGYFDPLIKESAEYTGSNIVNICVDEGHRGKGVGKLLVTTCIQNGRNPVHLDVIADNLEAVKLYSQCGFSVESKYLGFSGEQKPLPCYHMIRRAK